MKTIVFDKKLLEKCNHAYCVIGNIWVIWFDFVSDNIIMATRRLNA